MKDKFSVDTYKVILWGEEKIVSHLLFSGVNALLIRNNFEHFCPKCTTPYPEPSHGDELTCSKCYASYEFFGALHPNPIGETRNEVDKIMKDQGITLKSKAM